MTLPGGRVLRVSKRWLGREATTRVIEPLVADWQREWLDAGSPAAQVRAWCAGASAATVTLTALSAHALTTSPRVRPVLRSIALMSLLFSADALADARTLPWATAAATIATSAASWMPVIVSGALWLSRRYARRWQVTAAVTIASTAVVLVVGVIVAPANLALRSQASAATAWLTLLGPAIFALLSGAAAIAHMRSGRRHDRVFSIPYVATGTLVCTAFLIVVATLRGRGVERALALGLATVVVFLPAVSAFVVVAETARRRFVGIRGRRHLISEAAQ